MRIYFTAVSITTGFSEPVMACARNGPAKKAVSTPTVAQIKPNRKVSRIPSLMRSIFPAP